MEVFVDIRLNKMPDKILKHVFNYGPNQTLHNLDTFKIQILIIFNKVEMLVDIVNQALQFSQFIIIVI
jgi:hypothetical protein